MNDEFKALMDSIESKEDIVSSYKLKEELSLFEDGQKDFAEQDFFQEDLSPVIDDVVHSLTAEDPKRNYRSGQSGGYKTMISLVKKWKSMEKSILCAPAAAIYAEK